VGDNQRGDAVGSSSDRSFEQQMKLHRDMGADPNENQGAPLLEAAKQKCSQAVEILLQYGADMSARRAAAFFTAIKAESQQLVRLFIDRGVGVNLGNALPLRAAMVQGSPDSLLVAKMLIESGGDVQIACMLSEYADRCFDANRGSSIPFCYGPSYASENYAWQYVELIGQMFTPESPHFINKLVPERFRLQRVSSAKIQKSALFRFLSSCAAAAVLLGRSEQQLAFFRSFVSKGFQLLEHSNCRLSHLAGEHAAACNALLTVGGLFCVFEEHVVLPILASPVATDNLAVQIRRFRDNKNWKNVRDLSSRILFGERSLLEVSRLYQEWMRLLTREPVFGAPSPDFAWRPIIQKTVLAPGITIEAVTTLRGLLEEGALMNNCLREGSYVSACLQGTSHILSMRQNKVPVMTVTLKQRSEGGSQQKASWYVAEYQGPNHTEPSKELRSHLALFQSKLTSKEIPTSRYKLGSIGGVNGSSNSDAFVRFFELGVRIRPDIPKDEAERISLLTVVAAADRGDIWREMFESIVRRNGGRLLSGETVRVVT
jgi:hypothetical protein